MTGRKWKSKSYRLVSPSAQLRGTPTVRTRVAPLPSDVCLTVEESCHHQGRVTIPRIFVRSTHLNEEGEVPMEPSDDGIMLKHQSSTLRGYLRNELDPDWPGGSRQRKTQRRATWSGNHHFPVSSGCTPLREAYLRIYPSADFYQTVSSLESSR